MDEAHGQALREVAASIDEHLRVNFGADGKGGLVDYGRAAVACRAEVWPPSPATPPPPTLLALVTNAQPPRLTQT